MDYPANSPFGSSDQDSFTDLWRANVIQANTQFKEQADAAGVYSGAYESKGDRYPIQYGTQTPIPEGQPGILDSIWQSIMSVVSPEAGK